VVKALWECPKCARRFANRNQTHTCATLGDIDRHFVGKDPRVRAAFDRVLEVVAAIGPAEILPEKTRIALHARMSFAAFVPRRRWLDGHLVLARRVEDARFRKVEVYSRRNVLHAFRLLGPLDVDEHFAAYLSEAYQVGRQQHRSAGPH
jgi:hypothetical protein